MRDYDSRPQIGVPFPRADAWTKVVGREKYAADYYDRDFLWAGLKRSDVPHAELVKVNRESARTIKGVRSVLTAEDVPGSNRMGMVKKDQPVLSDDKIRRIGDPVALVLAESREALQKALEAIDVETRELPAVFDPQTALAEHATVDS